MIILFRLVKSGYGSFEEVSRMSAREVIQAVHYENFISDYESSYMEINREHR